MKDKDLLDITERVVITVSENNCIESELSFTQKENILNPLCQVLTNNNSVGLDLKKDYTNHKNVFILGKSGHGKGIHPWDHLKECTCGGYPWMLGTDGTDFNSGSPYKIVCTKCHKCTNSSNYISAIKTEWNEFLN